MHTICNSQNSESNESSMFGAEVNIILYKTLVAKCCIFRSLVYWKTTLAKKFLIATLLYVILLAIEL